MKLSKLRLYDFRNFEKLDIEFESGLNILYGDNAQGKTNVLESIFFLSNFEPAIASREAQLIRFGRPLAYLKGIFETDTGFIEREITLYKNKKKIVKEQGKKVNKRDEIISDIKTVFFSPDDLKIVKGEPQIRRKYLDMILYQARPALYKYLKSYYKVLSQRNMLLKSIKRNPKLINTLDPWDKQLSKFGALLIKERLKILKKLSRMVKKLFLRYTQGRSNLDIKYLSSVKISNLKNFDQEFLNLLKDKRSTDVMRTYTSIGPHRDDIQFLIDGIDARYFASQGQQRLITLCLKFTERDFIKEIYGTPPILLLDDVMSELDILRRRLILEDKKQQVLLTTTDFGQFPDDILKNSKTLKISSNVLR